MRRESKALERALEDFIVYGWDSPEYMNPEQVLVAKQYTQCLQAALHASLMSLSPREFIYVSLRYGTLSAEGEPCTLRVIADLEGISPTRVSQIIAKALRKLKHPKHKALRAIHPYKKAVPVEIKEYVPEKKTPQKLQECSACWIGATHHLSDICGITPRRGSIYMVVCEKKHVYNSTQFIKCPICAAAEATRLKVLAYKNAALKDRAQHRYKHDYVI